MATLESIKTKLINDAQEKAELIKSEAKSKANSIIEKMTKEANSKSEAIMNKAKADGGLLTERLISSGKLKARNEILKAKGEVMDKVFNNAMEELRNIDENTLLSFIEKRISGRDLKGAAIHISSKLAEKVMNMTEADVISDDEINGFKITKNGITENYSFERMVNQGKDDLQAEIAEILFQ